MTTKNESEAVDARRRRFLRTAGLGSIATVAGAAAVTVASGEAVADDGQAVSGKGYHVTDHVRQAYDLYRF